MKEKESFWIITGCKKVESVIKYLYNYSLHSEYCVTCRENPLYFHCHKFHWCNNACTWMPPFWFQLCAVVQLNTVMCYKSQHLKIVISLEHVKQISLNPWCKVTLVLTGIISLSLTHKRNLEMPSLIICCHFLDLEWALQTPWSLYCIYVLNTKVFQSIYLLYVAW